MAGITNIRKIIGRAVMVTVTLLPMTAVSGQTGSYPADYITQKFYGYCNSTPWEEIYVHSDRDEYTSGEEIWFTTYLFDRQSLDPSKHSRIVYLELLDPENKPVVRKKIFLHGGIGEGNFRLSDTLASGSYSLRAYTNWMKNFLPGNCFLKDINIYNAQLSGTFKRKSPDADIKEAVIKEAVKSGISLQIIPGENGDREISIETNTGDSSAEKSVYCLFIQAHGNIGHAGNFTISGGKSNVIIPQKAFSPGINQITLFDSQCRPVYEKFIYVSPAEIRPMLLLKSDKRAGKREKVTLDLQVSDLITNPSFTSFSVSIAPNTGEKAFPDINEYLLFGSEFGTDPALKLNGIKPGDIGTEEMDMLLTGLRSNWINWEKIFSDHAAEINYPAESEEHFIYGTLMETDSWPALNNEIVLMSQPGKSAQFQYAVTDIDGNFSFSLPVDEAERDLLIQPDNPVKFTGIINRSQFIDFPRPAKLTIDSSGYEVPGYISKWGLNYRVCSVYGMLFSDEQPLVVVSNETKKRFYGKPDFELILDNFMKLPSMEEIFFELVPGVRLKKWESVCDITILDPLGNRLYNELPGLMIDGVIVKNPALIADLDPGLVEKIDVVFGEYVVDAYTFHGLVNVITKSADLSSVTLPRNCPRFKYRITEPRTIFVTPEYSDPETRKSRIPDLRNTMYWNPSLQPDKDGHITIEFWTSDYATEYVINIQGITGEGNAVSLKSTFITEPDERR